MQKGGKQGGLAVVAGAEGNKDGLLLRGAAERIPEGALEVLDHALGAVQFRFGGIRVVAHDAGNETPEHRADRLGIVVVVHQLGEVALGIVRQQHAGFEVEGTIQEIQQEWVRVELVRRDHELALGHGEQVADALCVQGAVSERPVILVFGIYSLGQVLQHGLLGQAPGGSLPVNGPTAPIPHQPLLKCGAVAEAVAELQDQAVGVPRVITKLLEQTVFDRLRRFQVRLRSIRGCRRQLHRGRVGHDLLELVAGAARIDPIPEIAFGR